VPATWDLGVDEARLEPGSRQLVHSGRRLHGLYSYPINTTTTRSHVRLLLASLLACTAGWPRRTLDKRSLQKRFPGLPGPVIGLLRRSASPGHS